jgi:hypothetical protein
MDSIRPKSRLVCNDFRVLPPVSCMTSLRVRTDNPRRQSTLAGECRLQFAAVAAGASIFEAGTTIRSIRSYEH